jgi:SpoVK/Ycf46/Vps4 family AAA+-type ATPase
LTDGLIVLVFVYWCHQILVPLPEAEARQAMFAQLLLSVTSKLEVPYDVLVEKTVGYSGSDIHLVCKEAAMQPLRRLMSVLEASDEVMPEEGEFWFYWHSYSKFTCIYSVNV